MSAETFRLLPMHSTAGPARHSGGEHRRKCLPTNYTQVHDTVLRRWVESALSSVIRVEYRTGQTAAHRVGGCERILDKFGAHMLGNRPPGDPA